MFKFITRKKSITAGSPPLDQNTKLNTDFFHSAQCCDRGFPSKPSCLAFDKVLGIIAIGTRKGELRIYGKPGFQLSASTEGSIRFLDFFPDGQGRMLCLLDSGSVEIWELNNSDVGILLKLVLKSPKEITEQLEQFTAQALLENSTVLSIGEKSGDVTFLILAIMTMASYTISKLDIQESIPEEHKTITGIVEAICPHPTDMHRLLIGYSKGVFVLWNIESQSLEQMYLYNQQIESLCWYGYDGVHFASSHNDGSYIFWRIDNEAKPHECSRMPYGPFPCRAINKIAVKILRNDEPLVVFAGGLPRSGFPDKSCVSISYFENDLQIPQQVPFDLSSRFVDMLIVDKYRTGDNESKGYDEPSMLLILTEEELVAVDLLSKSLCVYRMPYLIPVHLSPLTVTCTCQISSILLEQLKSTSFDSSDVISDRDWPIWGGEYVSYNGDFDKDMIFSGHEDGSICIWDISQADFPLICRIRTSKLFEIEHYTNNADTSYETPFLRQIGIFDPCTDDHRVSIHQISVAKRGCVIAAGGASGQIMIFQYNLRSFNQLSESPSISLDPISINLIESVTNVDMKQLNCQNLPVKNSVHFSHGYNPIAIIQLFPVSLISALSVVAEAGLIIAGSMYGFFVFDYIQLKTVFFRCTINSEEIPRLECEPNITKGRSLKKALRASFRRLRQSKMKNSFKNVISQQSHRIRASMVKVSEDVHSIERKVESREFGAMEDWERSVVRYIYTCLNYVSSSSSNDLSIFFGTNNGDIFIYTIQLPTKSLRQTLPVSATMSQEISLRHKAPIIAISMINHEGYVIPCLDTYSTCSIDCDFDHASRESTLTFNSMQHNTSMNKLVICSQEQLKVLILPQLRQCYKYKLTATEGCLVKKVFFTKFTNKSDSNSFQSCLLCLTNAGDLIIFSLPNLRKLITVNCMKPQDIAGLTHFCITATSNHAIIHTSPSEFREISYAAIDPGFRQNMQIDVNSSKRMVLDTSEPVDSDLTEEDDDRNHAHPTFQSIKRLQNPITEDIAQNNSIDVNCIYIEIVNSNNNNTVSLNDPQFTGNLDEASDAVSLHSNGEIPSIQ